MNNITASSRQRLDGIPAARPDLARASSGRTDHVFVPDPDKTFHRGSTDYFVTDRKIDIGAFDSPTFTGLAVGEVLKVGKHDLTVQTREPLSTGDGLNVLIKREVVGFRASVRSEGHTSALPSLLRRSSAVFLFRQKNKNPNKLQTL